MLYGMTAIKLFVLLLYFIKHHNGKKCLKSLNLIDLHRYKYFVFHLVSAALTCPDGTLVHAAFHIDHGVRKYKVLVINILIRT